MKKIILGTLISAATIGSSFAECSISNWSLSAVEGGSSSSTYISGQKIVSKILAKKNENAIASSGSVNISNRNMIAFEYEFNIPKDLVDDENIFASGINTSGNSFDGIILGILRNSQILTDNFVRPTGTSLTGPTHTNDLLNNTINKIGVYLNRQTRQVGYIVNGVNKGYIWIFSNNEFNDLSFNLWSAYMGFAVSSSKIDSYISVELITDHAKLQNTYPTGTTDICGNII